MKSQTQSEDQEKSKTDDSTSEIPEPTLASSKLQEPGFPEPGFPEPTLGESKQSNSAIPEPVLPGNPQAKVNVEPLEVKDIMAALNAQKYILEHNTGLQARLEQRLLKEKDVLAEIYQDPRFKNLTEESISQLCKLLADQITRQQESILQKDFSQQQELTAYFKDSAFVDRSLKAQVKHLTDTIGKIKKDDSYVDSHNDSLSNSRQELLGSRIALQHQQEQLLASFAENLQNCSSDSEYLSLLKDMLDKLGNLYGYALALPQELSQQDQWQRAYSGVIASMYLETLEQVKTLSSSALPKESRLSCELVWTAASATHMSKFNKNHPFLRLQKLFNEDIQNSAANSTDAEETQTSPDSSEFSVVELVKKNPDLKKHIEQIVLVLLQGAVAKGGLDPESVDYLRYLAENYDLDTYSNLAKLAFELNASGDRPQFDYNLSEISPEIEDPIVKVDIRHLARIQGSLSIALGQANCSEFEKSQLVASIEWIDKQITSYLSGIKDPEKLNSLKDDIQKEITSTRSYYSKRGLSEIAAHMLMGTRLLIQDSATNSGSYSVSYSRFTTLEPEISPTIKLARATGFCEELLVDTNRSLNNISAEANQSLQRQALKLRQARLTKLIREKHLQLEKMAIAEGLEPSEFQTEIARGRSHYRMSLIHGSFSATVDECMKINRANRSIGFAKGSVVHLCKRIEQGQVNDKALEGLKRQRDSADKSLRDKVFEGQIESANEKLSELVPDKELRQLLLDTYLNPNLELRGFIEGQASGLVTDLKYSSGNEAGGRSQSQVRNELEELFRDSNLANYSKDVDLEWYSSGRGTMRLSTSVACNSDAGSRLRPYSESEIDLMVDNLISYDSTFGLIPGDVFEGRYGEVAVVSIADVKKDLAILSEIRNKVKELKRSAANEPRDPDQDQQTENLRKTREVIEKINSILDGQKSAQSLSTEVRNQYLELLHNLERAESCENPAIAIELYASLERRLGQLAIKSMASHVRSHSDETSFTELVDSIGVDFRRDFPEITRTEAALECNNQRLLGYADIMRVIGRTQTRINDTDDQALDVIRSRYPLHNFSQYSTQCVRVFICAQGSSDPLSKFDKLRDQVLANSSSADRPTLSKYFSELRGMLSSTQNSNEKLLSFSKVASEYFDALQSKQNCKDIFFADRADLGREVSSFLDLVHSDAYSDGARDRSDKHNEIWEHLQNERNKGFWGHAKDRVWDPLARIPGDLVQTVIPLSMVIPIVGSYAIDGGQTAGNMIYGMHRIRKYSLDGNSVYGTDEDFSKMGAFSLWAASNPVGHLASVIDTPFNALDLGTDYAYAGILGEDFFDAMHLAKVDPDAKALYTTVRVTSEVLQIAADLAIIYFTGGAGAARSGGRLAASRLAAARRATVLRSLVYSGGFGGLIAAGQELSKDDPNFEEFAVSFLKNTKFSLSFMAATGGVRSMQRARALNTLRNAKSSADLLRAEAMMRNGSQFLRNFEFLDASIDLTQVIGQGDVVYQDGFNLQKTTGFLLLLAGAGFDFADNINIGSSLRSNKGLRDSIAERSDIDPQRLKRELPNLLSAAFDSARLRENSGQAWDNLITSEQIGVYDIDNAAVCSDPFMRELAARLDGSTDIEADLLAFCDEVTGVRIISSDLSAEQHQAIVGSYRIFDAVLSAEGSHELALKRQIEFLAEHNLTLDLSSDNPKIVPTQNHSIPLDLEVTEFATRVDKKLIARIEKAYNNGQEQGMVGESVEEILQSTSSMLNAYGVNFSIDSGNLIIDSKGNSPLNIRAKRLAAEGKQLVFEPEQLLRRSVGLEPNSKLDDNQVAITEHDIASCTSMRMEAEQSVLAPLFAMLPQGHHPDTHLLAAFSNNGYSGRASQIAADVHRLTLRSKQLLQSLDLVHSQETLNLIVAHLEQEVADLRESGLDPLKSTIESLGANPESTLAFARVQKADGSYSINAVFGGAQNQIQFELCLGDRIGIDQVFFNGQFANAELKAQYTKEALGKLGSLGKMCSDTEACLGQFSSSLDLVGRNDTSSVDQGRESLATALETLPGVDLKVSSLDTLATIYGVLGLPVVAALLAPKQQPEQDDSPQESVENAILGEVPTAPPKTNGEEPARATPELMLPPAKPLRSLKDLRRTRFSEFTAAQRAQLMTAERITGNSVYMHTYSRFIQSNNINNQQLTSAIASLAAQKVSYIDGSGFGGLGLDEDRRFEIARILLERDPARFLAEQTFPHFNLSKDSYLKEIFDYVIEHDPSAYFGPGNSKPSPMFELLSKDQQLEVFREMAKTNPVEATEVLRHLAIEDQQELASILTGIIAVNEDHAGRQNSLLRHMSTSHFRKNVGLNDEQAVVKVCQSLLEQHSKHARSGYPHFFLADVSTFSQKSRYSLACLFAKHNYSSISSWAPVLGVSESKEINVETLSENQRFEIGKIGVSSIAESRKNNGPNHSDRYNLLRTLETLNLDDQKSLGELLKIAVAVEPELIFQAKDFGLSDSQQLLPALTLAFETQDKIGDRYSKEKFIKSALHLARDDFSHAAQEIVAVCATFNFVELLENSFIVRQQLDRSEVIGIIIESIQNRGGIDSKQLLESIGGVSTLVLSNNSSFFRPASREEFEQLLECSLAANAKLVLSTKDNVERQYLLPEANNICRRESRFEAILQSALANRRYENIEYLLNLNPTRFNSDYYTTLDAIAQRALLNPEASPQSRKAIEQYVKSRNYGASSITQLKACDYFGEKNEAFIRKVIRKNPEAADFIFIQTALKCPSNIILNDEYVEKLAVAELARGEKQFAFALASILEPVDKQTDKFSQMDKRAERFLAQKDLPEWVHQGLKKYLASRAAQQDMNTRLSSNARR